jgi:hypothetical protein
MRRISSLTPFVVALAMLLVAVSLIAQEPQEPQDPPATQDTQDTLENVDTLDAEVTFTAADVFLELNDSDGDLGFHGSTASSTTPWILMKIIGPTGLLLEFTTRPELTAQGMSQVDFESAEPPFDELSPSRFFRRFPEGRYAIVGHGAKGERIKSYASLSHIMAAVPGNVLLNGVPAARSCDDPLPTLVAPVTVTWDPVTQSHPRIGKRGPVRIARYQIFVEGGRIKLSTDLEPTITSFDIPTAVTDGAREFKFEIIAQTSTGNNTALETCFLLQ